MTKFMTIRIFSIFIVIFQSNLAACRSARIPVPGELQRTNMSVENVRNLPPAVHNAAASKTA
jgi:hypothetical protein